MRGFTTVNETRFFNTEQSWVCRVDVKHAKTGRVLRVTVRRNAYDEQSHKIVVAFDPISGSWHLVQKDPLLKTDPCYSLSYVTRELSAAQKADLLATAESILGSAAAILNAATPE